jgi:hypothetical protein
MVDIGKTTTAFHKSQDDIWYLTPTCTAYLVKPDAINRLFNVAQERKLNRNVSETLRVDMHPECVSVPECWWTSVKMVVM